MTPSKGLPSWVRPMRRTDREIVESERLWEILRAAEVCRVAFCGEGWPYIVPMNFGCGENRLYFHCAAEGTKLDLLRANANVCFEVEANVQVVPGQDACNWSVRYQSVIGLGHASLVTDVAEKRTAVKALLAQYSVGTGAESVDHKKGAIPAISNEVALFRIDVLSLTGKESLGD